MKNKKRDQRRHAVYVPEIRLAGFLSVYCTPLAVIEKDTDALRA
jgi:hypothetical protein